MRVKTKWCVPHQLSWLGPGWYDDIGECCWTGYTNWHRVNDPRQRDAFIDASGCKMVDARVDYLAMRGQKLEVEA